MRVPSSCWRPPWRLSGRGYRYTKMSRGGGFARGNCLIDLGICSHLYRRLHLLNGGAGTFFPSLTLSLEEVGQPLSTHPIGGDQARPSPASPSGNAWGWDR